MSNCWICWIVEEFKIARIDRRIVAVCGSACAQPAAWAPTKQCLTKVSVFNTSHGSQRTIERIANNWHQMSWNTQNVWIQGWKLFYQSFVWDLLCLSGKRGQDTWASAIEKKEKALCHKKRQESKDWVFEKQEFYLFLPLFKWGQHRGRNQSAGSPVLCDSTFGWKPPNQRWTTREPVCLSSRTLRVPRIPTSQPATTKIEAHKIRRNLEI